MTVCGRLPVPGKQIYGSTGFPTGQPDVAQGRLIMQPAVKTAKAGACIVASADGCDTEMVAEPMINAASSQPS
jgi:hypothetical protein